MVESRTGAGFSRANGSNTAAGEAFSAAVPGDEIGPATGVTAFGVGSLLDTLDPGVEAGTGPGIGLVTAKGTTGEGAAEAVTATGIVLLKTGANTTREATGTRAGRVAGGGEPVGRATDGRSCKTCPMSEYEHNTYHVELQARGVVRKLRLRAACPRR